MSFLTYLAHFPARRRAVAKVREVCTSLLRGELIRGTYVCADEPERFVVLVFWGTSELELIGIPPWKECWSFAVNKASGVVHRIHDPQYRVVGR